MNSAITTNLMGTQTPLYIEDIELSCMESSKEKRMVISLILFRCAKHSILPRKTGTLEK
jgi:hypothetical protein